MTDKLLTSVIDIAEDAGSIALNYFCSADAGVEWKEDNTPVTRADHEMHELIHQRLTHLDKSIPIISEEMINSSYQQRKHWHRAWIVDPLDGTKHYIAGKKDYSVNIALVENGTPILSVVHAPSLDLHYYAVRGEGSFRRAPSQDVRLQCPTTQEHQPLRVVISHGQPGWRLENYVDTSGDYTFVRLGSSLKQCWIAEGLADVYPRFGKTNEWDTAAAQLVLEEAGGCITDVAGITLRYNKEQLANPEFVAYAPWYQPPSPWY